MNLIPRSPFVTSALFAGVLLALCVPPLPLGPALPLVLAYVFHSLGGLEPRTAFRWGFLSGLPQYLGSLFWLFSVGRVATPALVGAGVVLLVLVMSLWSGLWAWAYSHCERRRFGLYLFPFLWVGIEQLRSMGELAFPWHHLAYDLGEHLFLIQGTSIVGAYVLSGMLVATGLVLSQTLSGRLRHRWLLAPLAVWSVWASYGLGELSRPVEGPALRVAVVQPAIPQTNKWSEPYFAGVMEKTFAAAARVKGPVDLVAFPETAVPDFWPLRPLQGLRLAHLADSLRGDVVIGGLDYDRDPAAPRGAWIRNGAFLIAPGKPLVWRYDKIMLVPFGERVPFDWIPLVSKVDLEQGGFHAGREMRVRQSAGMSWAPTLCYELIFPEMPRLAHEKGARMLVNLTNDGWFGRSIGPWQHLNIQRLRAVESGMPLVRSANTGISCVVDHHGRMLAQTRLMADTVIQATVHAGPKEGSFYVRHGRGIERALWWLALAGALALPFLPRRRD